MRFKAFLYIALGALVLVSCAKRKERKQAEEDDRLIQEYLQAQGLSATKTESGLYYLIESQGTGIGCMQTSDVRVAYTGYYLDGEVFDASDAQGITVNLQNVIKGWTEGIPYFREGGVGKLFIPSALAYGTKGTATIPQNAVIIFDVELLEVLP